jgi:sec-independent protein translocase protein TatB
VFNLGAGEVLVILLLALIVLGPQRLPDAARHVGKVAGDIKRLSSGFQSEMKAAFDAEAEAAARDRGAAASGTSERPAAGAEPASGTEPADRADPANRAAPGGEAAPTNGTEPVGGAGSEPDRAG